MALLQTRQEAAAAVLELESTGLTCAQDVQRWANAQNVLQASAQDPPRQNTALQKPRKRKCKKATVYQPGSLVEAAGHGDWSTLLDVLNHKSTVVTRAVRERDTTGATVLHWLATKGAWKLLKRVRTSRSLGLNVYTHMDRC